MCEHKTLVKITALAMGNPDRPEDMSTWEIKYCPDCKISFLYRNGELQNAADNEQCSSPGKAS